MTPGLDDKIVVFAGPSLPPESRPSNPAFEWRAPAIAGDAYALGDARPRAVVLIDGLFDDWPAIRHKELLHLVGLGIPVIGGASMGALRAAELHRFGMIGVGRIFAAFAAGRLDADDEVAVLHGPAGLDWASLTEPLVNVRATLLSAARQRILDFAAARGLLEAARAMFYKERTWQTLLGRPAVRAEIVGARLDEFERWLPHGYVDLKRIDALSCLEAALALAGAAPPAAIAPETLFALALSDQVVAGLMPGPESLARR